MNEVFADTSGWANYFVRSEPFHSKSVDLMRGWYAQEIRVITTDYVLLELIALFTSPLRIPRFKQIQIIETIKNTPWVTTIHIDQTRRDEAWDLLKVRQDKNWSWVDCASFVVMEQRHIADALTTDPHFEQAGYLRTLK